MKTLEYEESLQGSNYYRLLKKYKIAFPSGVHSYERFPDGRVEIKLINESLTLDDFMQVRKEFLNIVTLVFSKKTFEKPGKALSISGNEQRIVLKCKKKNEKSIVKDMALKGFVLLKKDKS